MQSHDDQKLNAAALEGEKSKQEKELKELTEQMNRNDQQKSSKGDEKSFTYQKALLETKLNFYRDQDRKFRKQIKQMTEENEKLRKIAKENNRELNEKLEGKNKIIDNLEEKFIMQEELTDGIENLRQNAVEHLERLAKKEIEFQRQIQTQNIEIRRLRGREFELNKLVQSKQEELEEILAKNAELEKELEEIKMDKNIQQGDCTLNQYYSSCSGNSTPINNSHEQNYKKEKVRKRRQFVENSTEIGGNENILGRNAKKKAIIAIASEAAAERLTAKFQGEFSDSQEDSDDDSPSIIDNFTNESNQTRAKRGRGRPRKPMNSTTLINQQKVAEEENGKKDTTAEHWGTNGRDGHLYNENCQECKRIYGI